MSSFRMPARMAGFLYLTISIVLLAGCNQTFRQIAIPINIPAGDPANFNLAVVASKSTDTSTCDNNDLHPLGAATEIDVSGDSNVAYYQAGVDPAYVGLSISGGRAFVVSNGGLVNSFQTNFSGAAQDTVSMPLGSNATFIFSRQ